MQKTVAVISVFLLSACAIGPDYVRPATEPPPVYKESLHWKQATPSEDAMRGKWWEVFADPTLNGLTQQVDISNQNVKAAEAQFRQARALIGGARASYLPSVTGNASMTRDTSPSGTFGSGGVGNKYAASLDAAWEPDLWGRIRRTVESSEAGAEASAADLASARLSAQAELVIDYLNLRVVDEQIRFLNDTVTALKKSLDITQNLYKAGIQSQGDVLLAKVQFESTSAQAINAGIARAQLEHAIATLIGKAPAAFTLAEVATVPALPAIPLGVPSELLERRPDIAAAERRVVEANANIGVAKAVFFPNLLLSADGGFQSGTFADWFSLPNRVWSIGPSVVLSIFDAGLRSSQSEGAIAAYDQTVALYRQSVLSAFQEVEDNMAALRILAQETEMRKKAVEDATASTTVALNQYKAGIVSYLSVVTSQTAELNNKLSALEVHKQSLVAAATLIKALGGGWQSAELAKPEVTTPETGFFSILPPSQTPAPAATPIPASDKK